MQKGPQYRLPKRSSREFQQAPAIIRQRPGISRDRLAVCLGWLPKIAYDNGHGQRYRPNPKIIALISALVEAGEVRAERERFAKMNEPPKLYPIDWVAPEKRVRHYDPPLKIYWVGSDAGQS